MFDRVGGPRPAIGGKPPEVPSASGHHVGNTADGGGRSTFVESAPVAPTPPTAAPLHQRDVYGAQRSGLRQLLSWLGAQHFAFGRSPKAGDEIQFGYEHEGEAPSAFEHYRPPEESEAAWRSMTLAEREDYIVTRPLGLVGLVRMGQGAEDARYLPRDLERDGPKTHETKPPRPFSTLGELFRATSWVRWAMDPDGRTQFNVSFIHDPAFHEEEKQLVAQVAEYLKLRMIARARAPNAVRAPNFRAYTAFQLEEMQTELQAQTPNLGEHFKFSTFAPRTGKYGDARRVNLELRGLSNNMRLARRIAMGTVAFLENPKQFRIRLGSRNSQGYTASEVSKVDRLSLQTMQRYPPQVRELLEDVGRGMALGQLGMSAPSGIPPQFLYTLLALARDSVDPSRESLFERTREWGLPMVAWENRPGMPQAEQALIQKERVAFVHELELIGARAVDFRTRLGACRSGAAATLVAGQVPGHTGESLALRQEADVLADEIDRAVTTFFRNTDVHEYL